MIAWYLRLTMCSHNVSGRRTTAGPGCAEQKGAEFPGEQRDDERVLREALQEALARYGTPEIFNTDQGTLPDFESKRVRE
jgi:hypothetical protein